MIVAVEVLVDTAVADTSGNRSRIELVSLSHAGSNAPRTDSQLVDDNDKSGDNADNDEEEDKDVGGVVAVVDVVEE